MENNAYNKIMKKVTDYYLLGLLLSGILTVIDFYIKEDPTKIGGISIFMFGFFSLSIIYVLIGSYYKHIKK